MDITQQAAAYCITAGWVGYAIACPLWGILSDALKQRRQLMTYSALLGVICATLLVLMHHSPLYIYFVLFIGMGAAAAGTSLSFVLLAEKVDSRVKASATALNNSMISVYVALLTMASSAFINAATGGSIRHAVPDQFVAGLSLIPLSWLLAFLLSGFVIREKKVWLT